MSVLFSNTRTRLLYNEREIFNTARSEAECSIEISSSLYSKRVRVFENKTPTTVSNPFNIQFEFTAGDRPTMASRPTCLNEKTMNTAQFLCVIVITHSVTLMSLGNGKPRDQF